MPVDPFAIGSGHVPDEPPAEDPVGEIVVIENAYGPGVDSVKFADGTPVGVWMRELNLDPEDVEARLLEMGLDVERAAKFRRIRQMGIDADRRIMADPAVQAFARVEADHYRRQEGARAEFKKERK